MGNEIVKLKKENKRTKTSIQRMKSFVNQRKNKVMRDQHNQMFGLDEKRRLGRIENYSNLSKCDSDRKHHILGGGLDFIQDSDLENNNYSSGSEMDEMKNKRMSVRNVRGKGMVKGART